MWGGGGGFFLLYPFLILVFALSFSLSVEMCCYCMDKIWEYCAHVRLDDNNVTFHS